jgi:hypothetical protein
MRGLFLIEARACMVGGAMGMLFPGFFARTFVAEPTGTGAVRLAAALLLGLGVVAWGALRSGEGIQPVLVGLLAADVAFLIAVAAWVADDGLSWWALPVCGFVGGLAVARLRVLSDPIRLSRLLPQGP